MATHFPQTEVKTDEEHPFIRVFQYNESLRIRYEKDSSNYLEIILNSKHLIIAKTVNGSYQSETVASFL